MAGLLEDLQRDVRSLREEVRELKDTLRVTQWTGKRCCQCGGMLVNSPAHPGAPGYCSYCHTVEHDGTRNGLIPGTMRSERPDPSDGF